MDTKTFLLTAFTGWAFLLLYFAYDCEFVWQMRNSVNNFANFHVEAKKISRDDVNLTEVYRRLDLRNQMPICARLFRGSPEARATAMRMHNNRSYIPLPPEIFIYMAEDCRRYRTERGYLSGSGSAEERAFPLAFSVLLYKDVEQVERLLRAIYRPQNVYCLHIDRKSAVSVHEAASAIASCLDNVFVVPDPVWVVWGTMTVLDAERSCLSLLWAHKTTWKYFINLTGQEFPLKTNAELVKILMAYNGANDIHFQTGKFNRFRRRTAYTCKDGQSTTTPYKPAPYKAHISIGSTHVAVPRAFVDYVLHDPKAKALYEWVRGTCIPDETYFNTLNVNPQWGVPGAYTGDAQVPDNVNLHYTRFKRWHSDSQPCRGRQVRLVCIMNVDYLPELRHAKEMFVNKFNIDYHPLALRCMEELIYGRTLKDLRGYSQSFNKKFYENADFVVKALRKPSNVSNGN